MAELTEDPFKWMTLRTLRREVPPEVKFLWGDKTNGLLQERSFMLLHSAEKQGKSMFMLNLAIAGARGDPDFLGFTLRPGGFKTVILQCEVHLRAIYERFEEMLKNGDITDEQADRIVINGYRAVTLSNDDMFSFFKFKLSQFKPDLVVIDPLAHMLTEDENSNVAVGKGLAPLLRLRDNPGCAIAVVHHDSKASEQGGKSGSSRPPQQRSRGANRLTADPDSILSLSPTKRSGGPTAKMFCMPRYGRTMPPLRVRLNEDTFWFERYAPETEYGEVLVEIIAKAHGKMDEDDLIADCEEAWAVKDSQGRHRTANSRIERAVLDGVILRHEAEGNVYYTIGKPKEEEEE